MNYNFKYLIRVLTMLFISTFLFACRSKKQITTNAPTTDNCKIDYKHAKVLTGHLKKNQVDFVWLSAKFDTKVTVQNKTTDFNVVFKCRKDSVIWMSIIDPLIGAVEGARVLLTRDSVKFMDRINKVYFIGGYDTIRKMINVEDLDYEMIQSLLVGNSVEFYEEDDKIKSGMDKTDCRYLLSTIRKRKLRRVMQNTMQLKDPAQSIWLNPTNYKIVKIFFTDFNTNRTFNAEYKNYQKLETDSVLYPFEINFDIKAEKSLKINVAYSKVTLNKEQSFPFTIPASYEAIKKKK